jgi:hypothetical protein
MAAGTFTVVETRLPTNYNASLVTQTYTCTSAGDISLAAANLPSAVLAAALPFGSAQIVITSGSAPTSIALLLGNDGILANMVPVGQTMTSFPLMIDLTSGVSSATTDVGAQTLASMPFVYFNWQIIGAAAPSVITITSVLMGTRG